MLQSSLIQHLLQILRDPVAQGLGAILTAFSVVISIVALRRQRLDNEKELSIEVLTNMTLFSTSPLVQDKLRVIYEGREISDLSMIHFVVRNSGRQPILPEDFYSPLIIHLSPNARIDEAEIVSRYPKDLTVSVVKSESNTIELAGTLMNPGDSVSVKIVVIGNDGNLEPEARIAGVSKITLTDRTARNRVEVGRVTLGAIAIAVAVSTLVSLIARVNFALSWIMTVSVINFAVFGYDKVLAKRQDWRVPEIVMHLISFFGGAPGAIAGMFFFRHKTLKPIFRIVNLLALSIWLIILFIFQT